ncbi:MAG: hypothetical protein MK165_20780 [Pirellulaceae bacterium]|nr:hypothetical protein [Pirellulaceae bacterium]
MLLFAVNYQSYRLAGVAERCWLTSGAFQKKMTWTTTLSLALRIVQRLIGHAPEDSMSLRTSFGGTRESGGDEGQVS